MLLKAQEHLAKTDPIMTELIAKHGDCKLQGVNSNPYGVIVRSIISQQLSAKAADTIEGRFINLVGRLSPDNVFRHSQDELRSVGLSTSKAKYILELSKRINCNLVDLSSLVHEKDEKVIEILTDIPGIGRWTAEMFLIFGLGRLDVLALADAGLKRAGLQLYGDNFSLEIEGKNWRPYRSVASWYLWKYLDG